MTSRQRRREQQERADLEGRLDKALQDLEEADNGERYNHKPLRQIARNSSPKASPSILAR